MRKLGGFLLIGVLALTACSAPAEQLSAQPLVGTVPSTTATITAAPIAPKAVVETETTATGEFGDPATDAAFLEDIQERWRGASPSDSELIGAAKLACQQFQQGIPYREMRLVEGTTNDDANNSVRIAIYAGRNYCTEYNPEVTLP